MKKINSQNVYCEASNTNYQNGDSTTHDTVNAFAEKIQEFYKQPGMLGSVIAVAPAATRDFISGLETKAKK